MINPWLIYFILKLDNFTGLLLIGGILMLIISSISILSTFITAKNADDEEDKKSILQTRAYSKKLITIAIIMMIIGTILPDTKQMAAIYVIPKVADSELAKNIPKILTEESKKLLENIVNEKSKVEDKHD